MNPIDPVNHAPPPTGSERPVSLHTPFWDYKDLFLFIFLLVPSMGVAVLIAAILTSFTSLSLPLRLFVAQTSLYVLALGSLDAMLRLRYQQPLWRSLSGNALPFSAAAACFLGGPLLALGLGIFAVALRMPEIPLPFENMLNNRITIISFAILVVVLGPLCEELVFRGFLMPVFIRTAGATAGVVITGVIFGLAHGYEYAWSWRHILLISIAGCVFGWARYKTGATAAAAFLHSTFNLTQFAAFLTQARNL